MDITAEQRKKLKGLGFLSNKGGIHFSARVLTRNGVLNTRQLRNLGEAADKFGNGHVSFTSRLTVEIPGIRFEDVENFQKHIAKENMTVGGTGPKVRPVVACKGTVCAFGLIDTQALALEIHKRFYEGYHDVILPNKFKIAVGGCPNNCAKPDLNDVGIVGHKDSSGEIKYKMYIGGRWGKQTRHGSLLSKTFTKEEVLDMLEKAILLFKNKGQPGERFASMIDRVGVAETEKMLFSDPS